MAHLWHIYPRHSSINLVRFGITTAKECLVASIQKRVNSDGVTTFRAQVRRKGFPPCSATFSRVSDARKWAADREAEMRQGKHFAYATRRQQCVSELIDRYIEEIIPRKPKSAATQVAQLDWWRNQIGRYSLADITVDKIATVRASLLKGEAEGSKPAAPATANRYMAVLRHAFNIAIDEWGWLTESPLRSLKSLPENQGRTRFLSSEEITALLAACQQSESRHLYVIVVLALSTGMRKSNILMLRWEDVDLERGRIMLKTTKNGRPLSVPLTGHALKLMEDYQTASSDWNRNDWVFPGPNGGPIDIRSAWRSALKRSGISDFRFHDLRHTAASYLAMDGASLTELAGVLGHQSLQMVKRYAHLSEQHTASIVASMNDKMFGGIDEG